MNRVCKFDVFDSNPSVFSRETFLFNSRSSALQPFLPSFCVEDVLDFHVNPSLKLEPTLQHRIAPSLPAFSSIESLSDRDRKYTWSAEIKSPEVGGIARKYTLTAEIKGGEKKGKGGVEKNFVWTAEIKGKGDKSPITRKYTFGTSSDDAGECGQSEKKKDKNGKSVGSTRVVEIEDPSDYGAVILRQAFAKRAAAVAKVKGKKTELWPQDAALMIQIQFKAYLIRRSQAFCALRELAVAKTKLMELRALFNNFFYRRRVSRDPEERQRFSEKMIVLLLTVDAIEGPFLIVRAAKKSTVDELEAMLDVVDPQPGKSSLSLRRWTFDMPDRLIEIEEPSDHGAVIPRQAFAERPAAVAKAKGKKTKLSPGKAATIIQIQFHAYMIRRSQAFRALRELAVAKTKLKRLRALFNHLSYRLCLRRDPEERQRFSEKIIVLLLSVDAIEGPVLMVRAAKKTTLDELEAMLDVVDFQPGKPSLSLRRWRWRRRRRRIFDMPGSVIQKELELAADVDPSDLTASIFLRQAYRKRGWLSPRDAAITIQHQFKAHLMRRSQLNRSLGDIDIGKLKLEEIKSPYYDDFSYRLRLRRNAEERQSFSEKISVLLLTIDGIEGVDMKVRAAKKSMADELEAMLDVVDPQPWKSSSLSLRGRKTFDVPDAVI